MHPAAGADAEERVYPAEKLVRLPDGIDDKVAAASFLGGSSVPAAANVSAP